MTAGDWTATAAQEWISHDPDPKTAAELLQCGEDELAERFAHPLTFGTAGLRGPLRGGPNGMNLAVVLRATWAVAKVLKDHGLHGQDVVVGRDARHGSDDFALGAAEVLAAQGFPVTLDVHRGTYARASRSPCARRPPRRGSRSPHRTTRPSDNGLQGVLRGRVPDRAAARRRDRAGHGPSAARRRDPVAAPSRRPASTSCSGTSTERPRFGARHGSVRVALTPLHGVGGEFALDALVAEQDSPMCMWSRSSSRRTRTSPPSHCPTPRSRARRRAAEARRR